MKHMRAFALILPLALSLGASACDDDGATVGVDPLRVYNQVERLGNPLVSEVFLAKRSHAFHNVGRPGTDVANHTTEFETFVTSFGRPQALADLMSSVLLPDMLIVQTDKAANTSGWLTWALANGYGGRNLGDDVVDAGLAATFGTLLNATAPLPAAFRTDNVNANNKVFLTTFPYLATAN